MSKASERTCIRCGEKQPLKNFRANQKGYRLHTCFACMRAYQRKREGFSLRSYIGTRLRRLKKDRSDLSADFILALYEVQRGRCAITGRRMTIGTTKPTNISIDRIDSSRPYERDNVQLVCLAVNYMKHELSQDDFIDWCRAVMACQPPSGGGADA